MKNTKTERGLAFRRIKAGLENAIHHAQGKKIDGRPLTVRQVELPDPPKSMSPAQIMALRVNQLGVSQPVFARMVNASVQTVQAWEQGRSRPSGPALRFLRVIERRPEVVAL